MKKHLFVKSFSSLIMIALVTCTFSACKSTSLKNIDLDIGKLVNQGVKIFDANTIDEKQEIQLGKNMSAVLLGTRPLIQNDAINRYVNKVGMWLATNSERPDIPWHFGVIDSTSINAFAAPGGYVFITSAMIKQLDNEAQLAAVLAHEIIHVTQYHHLNTIKDGALRDALTESVFDSADSYPKNTNASEQDKQYSAWAKQLTDAAQDLYSKGLDKDDEFEADKLGIKLLTKSGYDAYSFVDNLQLLAAISPDDSALALMYKTHPTPAQRLKAMANFLSTLDGDGKLITERFRSVMN